MKYVILIILLTANTLFAQCAFPFKPCWWDIHGWESVDFMYLWRKHRTYPPLATTSPVGTDYDVAGILGLPTTTVLFGGTVHDGPKPGVRADLGIWLAPILGIGGGFFAASTVDKTFFFGSDNYPILARPIISVDSGPSAIVIAFPTGDNATSGFIKIDTLNRIWGADFYGRYRVCCQPNFKPDILLGVMYVRIDDQLTISDVFNPIPAPPTPFPSGFLDKFITENRYLGALVGLSCDFCSLSWGLQGYVKAGIGNMNTSVNIEGSSFATDETGVTTFDAGLLALGTNIGNHQNNFFEVVTEVGAKLRFRVWKYLWATVGYNLIYWPKVALAADQIDLTINESQIGGLPLVGPARPAFNLQRTDFWVQGITAGIQIIF